MFAREKRTGQKQRTSRERWREREKRKRRNRDMRAARKKAAPELEKAESASSCSDLIPGLPSEVALRCILVRLPHVVQARLRLVCRAWKDAMEPTTIRLMRKTLQINSENLPGDRIYHPPQLRSCTSSLEFRFFGIIGHEVLIAVKPYPTAPVEALELQGLYSFDGQHMKWNDTRYSSLPSGCTHVCAADMDGGCLYAGETYNGLQRLDLKTKMWEVLPDPHVKRRRFAGVMLQRDFCMIGGVDANNSVCKSGEIWEMATQKWTLVPELWPFDSCENVNLISRVAVVADRLYALRTFWHFVELMYYETSSKSWISLGYLPDSNYYTYPCYQLFGTDQELWVINSMDMRMLASKPSLSQPLSWRILPNSLEAYDLARYKGAMLV